MSWENWDDLRFVLAVVDEGSVSAAARRLGVNHATVLRRIAAFEEAAGTIIFDKTARGYSIPADRGRIVDAAREVDRAVQTVVRLMEGARAPLTGEVRITSTDSFCQVLLPAILSEISRAAPEVRFQLLSSNAHLDLGRIEADITVRPTARLPDELVGLKAGTLVFRLYRARGADDALPWLGLAGQLSRTVPARWMAEHVPESEIGAGADSFLTLREMAFLGLGKAILPASIGDNEPRLGPMPNLYPGQVVDIWVASHADLASVPRIALMRRLLTDALSVRLAGAAARP